MSTQPSPKANIDLGFAIGHVLIDCSKGNVWSLTLIGDTTIEIINLYPGEDASIYVTQDSTGGYGLSWIGQTIQRPSLSSLSPSSGPNQSTNFSFIGVAFDTPPGTIRLMSASNSGGGGVDPIAYAALPDTNSTISVNLPTRGFTLPTVTHPLTITIDPTGAVLGDVLVLRRIDQNQSAPVYLAYDGTKQIRIMAASVIWVQFNGSSFQPVYATTRIGDQVRYVTDFYNDDGTRVVGDGVTDSATGIQRALNSLVDPTGGPCGRLHFPAGSYLTSAPLRVFGGGNNFSSIRITGDSGGTRGDSGTLITYIGPDNVAEALLYCVGISGSQIQYFDLNCNFKIWRGIWLTLEPLPSGDESSEFNEISYVTSIRPKEVAGAACFAVGPDFDTPGLFSSDVAFITFRKCLAVGNGATPIASQIVQSFSFRQWNNTKDFALYDCESYYTQYGIDWQYSSGSMFVSNHFFQSQYCDVIKHTGSLHITGCNTEGSAMCLIDTGGAPSSLTMTQWAWNGTPLDDDNVILNLRGQAVVDGCWFRNFRNFTTIVGFDDVAHTFIVVNGPVFPIQEASTFSVFWTSRDGSLPDLIVEGVTYFVKNVVHDSPVAGQTTFQVARTSGGAAIPFTGGSIVTVGGMSIAPQSYILMADQVPEGSGCALLIQNSWFTGMYGYLNVRPVANGLPFLDPNSSQSTPQLRGFNNFGGVYNAYRPLRERSGFPQETQQLSINLGSSDVGFQVVSMGVPGVPDVYLLDAKWLSSNLPASASCFTYLQAPNGVGIEWAVIDVETPMAGVGTAKFWLGGGNDFPTDIGNLLGTTGGIDCKTAGFKGRASGDLGALWASAILGAVYQFPSTSPPSYFQLSFSVDTSFSALTAGKVYVRIMRRYMAARPEA